MNEYPLYKLTLCEGEDEEEIVYARLTKTDKRVINESINGIFDAGYGYLIKTTDGELYDVGIIDKLEEVK